MSAAPYHGERFNSYSHLLGAVAATVGAGVLIVLAARQGNPWKIVSFSVYGTMLLLMYLFSTLYHGLHGRAKLVFRKLDHYAIYLLIAGTYTPFTLVTLRGAWGWSLFGVIWGLAVLGILVDSLPGGKRRILPVLMYLAMGWLVLIALKPLLTALPPAGFAWLLAGGMLYTVGIGFFALERRVKYGHGIWHIFVLAGSACHYFAVLFYVA
ncbi:MAG TPA: hemolysin III family protein [Burkholderiales bacterium]|nr:hemolysin III family protein [Burkholderiales bacterium]